MLCCARIVLDAEVTKKGRVSPVGSELSGGAEQQNKGPLLSVVHSKWLVNLETKIPIQPLLGNFTGQRNGLQGKSAPRQGGDAFPVSSSKVVGIRELLNLMTHQNWWKLIPSPSP